MKMTEEQEELLRQAAESARNLEGLFKLSAQFHRITEKLERAFPFLLKDKLEDE